MDSVKQPDRKSGCFFSYYITLDEFIKLIMNKRTRITNEKFSIRVCTIANSYGFKTIGSLYKFLKQCNPSAKLGLGVGHIRVFSLLKEVENELQP